MNGSPLAVLAPGGSAPWRPVGEGESEALVLRHETGDRFAKIMPPTRRAELEAERDRAAWLESAGLPGPSVLDWRDEGDGVCLVTSAVPGTPAHHLSPEALQRSWSAIGEVVNQLHSIPPDRCPFDRDLSSMMTLARTVVAEDRVHREFLPVTLQEVPAPDILDQLEEELPLRLEQEAAASVVCHGDLCLANIMIESSGEVSGLIDLGRLGRADPYADIPCC